MTATGIVACNTNLTSSLNTTYATDMTYDSAGVDLLTVTRSYTDPDHGPHTAVTTFQYNDPNNPGRVTETIPPLGTTYATTFAYAASGTPLASEAGLVITTTDALGNVTTFGYDAVGRRPSMVDPNGNVTGGSAAAHTWTYSYDKEDRLTAASAPAPTTGGSALTTQYQYDPVGNRTAVIDANSQSTVYAYDVRDSLAEVDQSPLAWPNPAVRPSTVISTTYSYDNLGNLSQVTRDKADSSNERGVAYTYDGLNRLRTETQYPSWPTLTPTLVTTDTYDLNSNLQTLQDPLGRTTTSAYDALNRLTSLTYSDGVTPNVSYGYDFNGNRTSMADGTGTTSYSYDELDRVITTTLPGPQSIGYRYDLDGNQTKLIYPDGTAVSSTYDDDNRLSALADWANRSTSYQYTPDGSLKQITNLDTSTSTLSYDNALRLTGVLNQLGTTTLDQHRYTLDSVGNRTQVAEILASPGTQNPSSWGLNSSGQLGATSSGSCGGNACSTTALAVVGSGGTGNLTGIIAASAGISHTVALRNDGTVWAWGDNTFGQLGQNTSGGTSASPVEVLDSSGLSGHFLTGITGIAAGSNHTLALKSDGTVWAWGNNASGQLGATSGNSCGGQHCSLVPIQVTTALSSVGAIAAGGSFSLALKSDGSTLWSWGANAYGQLGDGTTTTRLTPVQAASLSGGGFVSGITALAMGADDTFVVATTHTLTTTYGYDQMYRVTSGGVPGYPTSYSYDPVGNRTNLTKGTVSTAYTYDKADRIQTVGGTTYTVDANGNLTSDGTNTYGYDQTNRLTSATIGSTTTTYSYDGDGKRTKKVVGSTTTNYAWDANRSLPVVLTDGTLKYVYGLGLAYAVDGSGNVQVFHTDGLGSVRSITNGSGTFTQTFQTDEFGLPAFTQGASTEPFRYTGQQFDSETSFYDLRVRYYWPTLGRFLTRDAHFGAKWNALSLNRYAYVQNNPMSFSDPTGHDGNELHSWEGEGPYMGGPPGGYSGFSTSSSEDAEAQPSSDAAGNVGGAAVNAISRDSYQAVGVGTRVYRVRGNKSGPWGRYWTTVDPRTVENYGNEAGLPDENAGRFLSIGTITDMQGVQVTTAASLDGNEGGILEVQIPQSAAKIQLEAVIGLNPDRYPNGYPFDPGEEGGWGY